MLYSAITYTTVLHFSSVFCSWNIGHISCFLFCNSFCISYQAFGLVIPFIIYTIILITIIYYILLWVYPLLASLALSSAFSSFSSSSYLPSHSPSPPSSCVHTASPPLTPSSLSLSLSSLTQSSLAIFSSINQYLPLLRHVSLAPALLHLSTHYT